ncbi:T9SS type A sorting domain-containing protein [Winogradskyella helgolandensis]|uniref:T9SS type A sorting domain-containing protein n=1 Tax=Winogradskyella helgolandensis TaxID=2697010 RepID=UPI0015BA91D3|nr:T9SS type A sorting domain-containing protein [Winogradskyella helgolandensis]
MKKITCITFLLISAFLNAQTTYAIYTEDANIGAGVNALRYVNSSGALSLSQPTTAPYEGTENYLLSYDGSTSYLHSIFFPRNAANTDDTIVDLSAFTHYNIAMKTTSGTSFYLRMRGNGVTSKVLIDPTSNIYGFSNDGQWHLMSIPFADFVPDSGSFSLTTISEIFVFRSVDPLPDSENDFELDNIYVSDSEVLSVSQNDFADFKLYPNPATDNLTVKSSEILDSIKFYNILGQEVLLINPNRNNQTINITDLKSGVYIVKLKANGKTTSTKFIKE